MPNPLDAPPIRTQYSDRSAGESGVSRPWLNWFQSAWTNINKLFPVTPPATAASPGIPGQWAYDANFYYVCVATNTWRRTPIAPW